MNKRLAVVACAATLAVVGCSSGNKDSQGYGDAQVGTRDHGPAQIVNFPDGYPNVAFKCMGPNGLYVVTHDSNDIPPAVVVNDPQCPKVAR